jgi:Spy/CpxP family protein refolding chaperone
MKRPTGFLFICSGLLFVAALLVSGLGQASGEPRSSYSGMERGKFLLEIGLTSEQAKAFQTIDDKFDKSREGIIEEIKNNESDLEQVISSPQADEVKIKGLVAAVTRGHDQLFQTFKAQRQEEMALLTPIQQGRFLLALKKWHQEMKGNFKNR